MNLALESPCSKDLLSYSIYSGAGNTFVMIDNRTPLFQQEWVHDLCQKNDCDGLILLEDSKVADYRMRIYNRDGSEAEMCGNGLRAFVKFLEEREIAQKVFQIETGAFKKMGPFTAEKRGDEVLVHMPSPRSAQWNLSCLVEEQPYDCHALNTGVPHLILFFDSIEFEIHALGQSLRHHPQFQPQGTNVNFVRCTSLNSIEIRTYERGVEGETLACGTGATAAALVSAYGKGLESPIEVLTRSGETLTISFKREGDLFTHVKMQGPVKKIGEGSFFLKSALAMI